MNNTDPILGPATPRARAEFRRPISAAARVPQGLPLFPPIDSSRVKVYRIVSP
jgi:hypothetical protein